MVQVRVDMVQGLLQHRVVHLTQGRHTQHRALQHRHRGRCPPGHLQGVVPAHRGQSHQRLQRLGGPRQREDELITEAVHGHTILLGEDLDLMGVHPRRAGGIADRLQGLGHKLAHRVGVLGIVPDQVQMDAVAPGGAKRDRMAALDL